MDARRPRVVAARVVAALLALLLVLEPLGWTGVGRGDHGADAGTMTDRGDREDREGRDRRGDERDGGDDGDRGDRGDRGEAGDREGREDREGRRGDGDRSTGDDPASQEEAAGEDEDARGDDAGEEDACATGGLVVAGCEELPPAEPPDDGGADRDDAPDDDRRRASDEDSGDERSGDEGDGEAEPTASAGDDDRDRTPEADGRSGEEEATERSEERSRSREREEPRERPAEPPPLPPPPALKPFVPPSTADFGPVARIDAGAPPPAAASEGEDADQDRAEASERAAAGDGLEGAPGDVPQGWSPDDHFRGGIARPQPLAEEIHGTGDDGLYLTQRRGNEREKPYEFAYAIPVPADGTYRVRLYFAETFWGAPGGPKGAPGRRVFNVAAEGRRELVDYDIYADVGAMTAVVKEFEVEVEDGTLDLRFYAARGQPVVAAIAVDRVTGGER